MFFFYITTKYFRIFAIIIIYPLLLDYTKHVQYPQNNTDGYYDYYF